MAPVFLDDLDVVDPSTVETTAPTYPIAQWLNGDPKLAAAGGVGHTGGLILPLRYIDDSAAPAPGWTRATVAFASGKSEAVLATARPRLAVIRSRFRWFVMQNGVTAYYPRSGYSAEAGMRGHVQALCTLYGYDAPVVATFKGRASQEFERLLREFSQRVQDAAYNLAREQGRPATRYPRFAFYLRLAAGPHTRAGSKGQESIITPPVLELPAVIDEDYLNKTYVGRERLQALQQLYHDSASWAAAWDQPGSEASWEEQEPEGQPA